MSGERVEARRGGERPARAKTEPLHMIAEGSVSKLLPGPPRIAPQLVTPSMSRPRRADGTPRPAGKSGGTNPLSRRSAPMDVAREAARSMPRATTPPPAPVDGSVDDGWGALASLAAAPLPRLSDRSGAAKAAPVRRFSLAGGTRPPVPAAPAPMAIGSAPVAAVPVPAAVVAAPAPVAAAPAPVVAAPAPVAAAPPPVPVAVALAPVAVVPPPVPLVAPDVDAERAALHAAWLAEAAIANADESEGEVLEADSIGMELIAAPESGGVAPLSPPAANLAVPPGLPVTAAPTPAPDPAPMSFAPMPVAQRAAVEYPTLPATSPRATSTPWNATDEAFFSAGEALERGEPDNFDDLDAAAVADGAVSLKPRLFGRRRR